MFLQGTIFETIVQGSYVQGGVDSVKRSKPSNGRVSIRGDEGFNYKVFFYNYILFNNP